MSDGNNEPVEGGDDTNLDDFADLFYEAVNEPEVDESDVVEDDKDEDEDVEADADDEADEADESEEDDDELEDESESESDEPEEDEQSDEPEEDDKPHKNRKSAKERISELARERREERLAKEQAQAELAQLKARLDQLDKNPAPKEDAPASVDIFPDPDETGENGELVYPLGKLDPAYHAEVARRTIRAEIEAAEAQRRQQAEEAEAMAAQRALVAEWNVKLSAAEKDIPDLRSKIVDLEDTFTGLEPAQGIFLSETIMTMDRGVEVLNYLADNIGEAEEIVAMTPRKAVIALGRIEGRLPSKTKEGSKPKVSKAPKPPVATRGVGVAKRTPADTDNLEAFEREFYRK